MVDWRCLLCSGSEMEPNPSSQKLRGKQSEWNPINCCVWPLARTIDGWKERLGRSKRPPHPRSNGARLLCAALLSSSLSLRHFSSLFHLRKEEEKVGWEKKKWSRTPHAISLPWKGGNPTLSLSLESELPKRMLNSKEKQTLKVEWGGVSWEINHNQQPVNLIHSWINWRGSKQHSTQPKTKDKSFLFCFRCVWAAEVK